MADQITIVGNVGNDPELRYTAEGLAVLNFSVASNRRARGSTPAHAAWYRATAWRGLAEMLNQHLKKGQAVYITGHLTVDPETGRPRIWTDNSGNARASLELNVDSFEFIGAGRGNGQATEAEVEDLEEEDVPF
jgi:single-strand DNA-binding protein